MTTHAKRLVRDQDLLGLAAPDARPVVSLPPIPERVPCVTLYRRWASLVAAGVKTLETRTWAWAPPGQALPPGGPAYWLAMHAGMTEDNALLQGAVRPFPEVRPVPRGVIFAFALVTAIRVLAEEDAPRALVRAEGRTNVYAWELQHMRILDPMISLPRGYQKLGYVDGDVIRASAPSVTITDRFAAASRKVWNELPGTDWPVRSYGDVKAELGATR
jgi:hypothetical protein